MGKKNKLSDWLKGKNISKQSKMETSTWQHAIRWHWEGNLVSLWIVFMWLVFSRCAFRVQNPGLWCHRPPYEVIPLTSLTVLKQQWIFHKKGTDHPVPVLMFPHRVQDETLAVSSALAYQCALHRGWNKTLYVVPYKKTSAPYTGLIGFTSLLYTM